MCTALSVIFLLVANFLPVRVALLFISSIIIGVCILKYQSTTAIITFFATGIISFFLVENKLLSLAYVIIFGNYPILKLYIEKIRNLVVEYILKVILWAIELFGAYIVFCAFGYNDILNQALVWYCVAGVIIFFAYDLLFGMFINGFFKTYGKFFK